MASSKDRGKRDKKDAIIGDAVRQRQRVPISCLSCLRGKRACDREKPSCERCRIKQQECIYSTVPTEKPRLAKGGSKGLLDVTPQLGYDTIPMDTEKQDTTLYYEASIPALSSSHAGSLGNPSQVASPDETLPTLSAGGIGSAESGHTLPNTPESLESLPRSRKNKNGQSLWYGSSAAFIKKVPEVHPHCSSSPTMQKTIDNFLHPVTDFTFHGRSYQQCSIPQFKQFAWKLLPNRRGIARAFDELRRFLRPTLPTLLDDDFLTTAEELLLSRDEVEGRDAISLPWVAVLLMIMALGQESFANNNGGKIVDLNFQDDTAEWLKPLPPFQGDHPSDVFLSAAYQALDLSSFHSSPNLQTIYAQILMGLYLVHTERASTFWPILGSIARQAQAIGLHVEPKYNPLPDQDLRRRIWWAIVQQDVLLSSIFGRPLAISSFTCQITNPEKRNHINGGTSCLRVSSEFAMLQRRYLMENLFDEWTDEQLDQFKNDLLAWYGSLPEVIRISVDQQSRLLDTNVYDKLYGKSFSAMETTIDHFIEMQYTLLTLYRNRLHSKDATFRQESYTICGNVIHNIVTVLSTMIDLLGALQVGNVWLRIFYASHSGITAAFLCRTCPESQVAKQAKEDLTQLNLICQRLPQYFNGLKTVKTTFALLLEQVEETQQHGSTLDPQFNNTTSSNGISSSSSSSSHYTSKITSGYSSCNHPMPSDPGQVMLSSSNTSASSIYINELEKGQQQYNFDFFNSENLWSRNYFPEPFGPTDGPPGPQASGEEILSFWSQYFSQRSQPDEFSFG